LLESKRVNNVSIMLSKFRLKPTEIAAALEGMDTSKLSGEQLAQMLKLLPTPEEIELLSKVPEQDKPNLGKPESYFLQLMAIPRFGSKLECWYLSLTFDSKVAEIKVGADAVSNASQQVVNSKKFSQLLKVVLHLGNFINAGTFRGGASGIKLDTLNKLKDLKANDKKQTLLHFLVNFCAAKHPDLLTFFEEISFTEEAKNVSMQTLQSDFTVLSKGMTSLETEAKSGDTGPFANKIQEFMAKGGPIFEKVKTGFTGAQVAFELALNFFGEDPTTPEDFFGNIYRFHHSFAQIVAEVTVQQEKKKASVLAVAKDGQFLDNILTSIHDPRSKLYTSNKAIHEFIISASDNA